MISRPIRARKEEFAQQNSLPLERLSDSSPDGCLSASSSAMNPQNEPVMLDLAIGPPLDLFEDSGSGIWVAG